VAGDNLWTIARNHSASLAAILRWNAGVDPDRLVAGQRILVPGGTRMRTARSPATPRPTVRTTTTRPAAPNRASPRTTTSPRTTAPARSAGGHVWPLAVHGTITTRFSAAHPGIDIAAPLGTPVLAVAAGTVTWAGWKDNGGGYVVVIRHPDGMLSTYNHNSKLLVRVGDAVAAGQAIARVGSTGWATGPHLDFRIEMGGRSVDPLDVL
jgi:murein DD-endopeptidase MepM/ murein hydrolase activator NlpD